MSLPFTTTTVTIESDASAAADGLDAPSWVTKRADEPARVSGPSGASERIGQERVDAVLFVNPGTDLALTDRVTDQLTGHIYRVLYVQEVVGFGLDHTKAGLRRITGSL